jgi:hypothetical protein
MPRPTDAERSRNELRPYFVSLASSLFRLRRGFVAIAEFEGLYQPTNELPELSLILDKETTSY